MRNPILVLALSAVLGTGLSTAVAAGETVDVYKSPNCGCCGKWVDHLKNAGFEVRSHNVMDVPAARKQLGMPDRQGGRLCGRRPRASCRHSASAQGKTESPRHRGALDAPRFARHGKFETRSLQHAAGPVRR